MLEMSLTRDDKLKNKSQIYTKDRYLSIEGLRKELDNICKLYNTSASLLWNYRLMYTENIVLFFGEPARHKKYRNTVKNNKHMLPIIFCTTNLFVLLKIKLCWIDGALAHILVRWLADALILHTENIVNFSISE